MSSSGRVRSLQQILDSFADDHPVRASDIRDVIATLAGQNASGVSGTGVSSLPRWRLARSKVLSGQGNARVLCLGESTTFGDGGTNQSPDNGSLYPYCYPTQLAAMLTALGIPANAHGAAIGNLGSAHTRINGSDTRFTAGSSWVYANGIFSVGGSLLTASTNTNSLNFTPAANVDSFKVWYVQSGTHGTMGMAINSGSVTNQSTNGTPIGFVASATKTGTLGANTLNLTWVSGGGIYVGAIEAWDSTHPSVCITNAGWNAGKMADLSSVNSGSTGYDPLAGAVAFAPDLYIVSEGINDWDAGTPIPTFKSQYTTYLSALLAVADVIVVSPVPSNTSPAYGAASVLTQKQYVDAIQEVCVSLGIPFIDNWRRFGVWNSAMYSPDPLYTALHPNMIGYANFAWSIAQALAAA